MNELIDIYIKAPCHNWQGYRWVYIDSTRMSKKPSEAKKRYCELNNVHPDSVKCKFA